VDEISEAACGLRPPSLSQLRALAHELLTAVLDTFPLVGSVSANLAFFDQLHRAFREEKWRSFGKGIARAIASMHTLAQKVYGARGKSQAPAAPVPAAPVPAAPVPAATNPLGYMAAVDMAWVV
jgi:hypothetical protein